MKGYIRIENRAEDNRTVIDIEGIIGVAEGVQFEENSGSVSTYATVKSLLDRICVSEMSAITVNIRSTGGSVQDALLIYDFLRSTGAEVTTRCYGYAASAATIIAQAASLGRREISANALYLIHNASCEAAGNSTEMATAVDLLEQTDRQIAGIYAAVSGKDISVYRDLMGENGGRGRWLTPEQVVEYGLADVIAGKGRIGRRERKLVRDLALPPVPGNAKDKFIKAVGAGIERIAGLLPAATAPRMLKNGVPDSIKEDGSIPAVAVLIKNPPTDSPARRSAGPTTTKPQEDPPVYEAKLSQNRQAYLEDLRNIKNG